MTTPTEMLTPEPVAAPSLIGRRTLRFWNLLILAIFVLAGIALGTGNERLAPPAVALITSGWLLAAAPAVAFLVHTFTHREQGLGRALRRSATGSGIALIVLGLMAYVLAQVTRDMMLPVGPDIFVLLAFAFPALGVCVIIRAWTTRAAAPDAPERFVLQHRRSTTTGLFLAFVMMVLLPKFSGGTLSSAIKTQLRLDLRHLVTAQQTFFADSARYATSAANLQRYVGASGSAEPSIVVGADGWSATITHAALIGVTCGVAVNATNPVDAGADSGEPACDR